MYVKHPWDKYGPPNFDANEKKKTLEELEWERDDIQNEIDRIERDIEDLEDELTSLRSNLSEVIVEIGSYIPQDTYEVRM